MDFWQSCCWSVNRVPGLSTTFEFELQLGVGLLVFLQDDLPATLQLRFIDLSDAGIRLLNPGSTAPWFLRPVAVFLSASGLSLSLILTTTRQSLAQLPFVLFRRTGTQKVWSGIVGWRTRDSGAPFLRSGASPGGGQAPFRFRPQGYP